MVSTRYVAAWYEGGKDHPKLALLHLDPKRAEIWLDASSSSPICRQDKNINYLRGSTPGFW